MARLSCARALALLVLAGSIAACESTPPADTDAGTVIDATIGEDARVEVDSGDVDDAGELDDAGESDDASLAPDATEPVDAQSGVDGGDVCAGLGPAACLRGGCVPTYDDACCPTCTMGGCADCTNPTYFACRSFADACMAAFCSLAAPWGCEPVPTPDCATATVVDVDSCSVRGCVPAFPSGVGAPDLGTATCVGIHADVCRVMCRRLAPPCPDGTVAEGDGSCYTDRCIAAFVCE